MNEVMAINEKWNSRIILLALIIVSAFIFFLAYINDCRYNEVRRYNANENADRDSLVCKQREVMSATLSKVTDQLDSITLNQKNEKEIVARDMDTIKQSLFQIGRTGRQILNSTK